MHPTNFSSPEDGVHDLLCVAWKPLLLRHVYDAIGKKTLSGQRCDTSTTLTPFKLETNFLRLVTPSKSFG